MCMKIHGNIHHYFVYSSGTDFTNFSSKCTNKLHVHGMFILTNYTSKLSHIKLMVTEELTAYVITSHIQICSEAV